MTFWKDSPSLNTEKSYGSLLSSGVMFDSVLFIEAREGGKAGWAMGQGGGVQRLMPSEWKQLQ